jgi:hypothetical protein
MRSMGPNGLGLLGRSRAITPILPAPGRIANQCLVNQLTDKARKLTAPNNATHTRNRSTCINVLPSSGEQSCIKRANLDGAASRRFASLSRQRISQP